MYVIVCFVDPLIDSWPLMQTPTPILTISGLYLLFVLWIGPRWMEHRKPIELRRTLIVYNAAQVIISTAFCLTPFFTGLFGQYMSMSCGEPMTGISKELQLSVSRKLAINFQYPQDRDRG